MPELLRGVDRAAFAVAFAAKLRRAGVPVAMPALDVFCRALAAGLPNDKQELYWIARVSLVRRQSEVSAFTEVFEAVFGDAVLPMDPNARRSAARQARPQTGSFAEAPGTELAVQSGGGLPWLTLPPAVAPSTDPEAELSHPLRRPSALSTLAEEPFELLDEHQLRALESWLAATLVRRPVRRSRRMSAGRGGSRIALRQTVARSRRTGWEPVELVRQRQQDRPRRIVMLCDVSQSMQAQSGPYFQLMRLLVLLGDAEAFAFSTGLTRLTPVLTHRSAQNALEQASLVVTDRFGGTRIAASLRALLASRHAGALRGAVVVIGSDGWDSSDPSELAAVMARLRRRAHRVLWLNPRVSAPGFEPLVSSMAAALPYCDRLLAGHSYADLARVGAAIADC
jgi:uncharacterized protein with von Willebrand factor type A (vWA) domain